jgi:hypothetical protein
MCETTVTSQHHQGCNRNVHYTLARVPRYDVQAYCGGIARSFKDWRGLYACCTQKGFVPKCQRLKLSVADVTGATAGSRDAQRLAQPFCRRHLKTEFLFLFLVSSLDSTMSRSRPSANSFWILNLPIDSSFSTIVAISHDAQPYLRHDIIPNLLSRNTNT